MRSGRVGVVCSEERVSELILSRSSLRTPVHWARFPEDFRVSYALRQHPVKLVKLLGITRLGLCSVRGVWCPGEVCCLRDWNSRLTLRWPGGTKGICGSCDVTFPNLNFSILLQLGFVSRAAFNLLGGFDSVTKFIYRR